MPARKRLLQALVVLVPAVVILNVLIGRTLLLQHTANAYKPGTVLLNEVVAKNLNGLTDSDGAHCDWIELYNPTDEDISLAGWGLSDDGDLPYRWVFEDTVLPAKGYLVVFASGKDRRTGEELHTNFALSGDGETLYLTNAQGEEADRLKIPHQSWDIPYGRRGLNPRKCGYFDYATPGEGNPVEFLNPESDADDILPVVKFSQPGGFYDESFSLTLQMEHNIPNARIVYTLDGSMPTARSETYRSPIEVQPSAVRWAKVQSTPQYSDWLYEYGSGDIATCFVVRAAVCVDGELSQVVTQTYWLSPQTTLPVVSLTTDPALLFDPIDGLYVPGQVGFLRMDDERAGNYLRGDAIDGNLELYDAAGQLLANDTARFTLAGNASRSFSQQKSFHVSLSSQSVSFSVDGAEYTLQNFDLRSPRTDEASYTVYRDGFAENLLLELELGCQAGTPVQLYLDGEYWGIYYLKETLDRSYLARHYGVDGGDVESLKISDDWQVKDGPEELIEEPGRWYDWLQGCDLRDPAQYAEVERQFDLENFAAYTAVQVFLNSTDWIQHENNVMLWRTSSVDPDNEYADGRWRFATYDLDIILQNQDEDTLASLLDFACDPDNDHYMPLLLFQKLWQTEDFRALFAEALNAQMETVFEPGRLTAAWEAHTAQLRPEMTQLLERIKLVPRDTLLARWWRQQVEPELRDPENIPVEDWDIYTWFVGDFVEQRCGYMQEYLSAALQRP